jgi:hypothetical protein
LRGEKRKKIKNKTKRENYKEERRKRNPLYSNNNKKNKSSPIASLARF